jgi:hypothetical protein
MQTYPVNFYDWQGMAYRANAHWHLVPKHLNDHLGLDWKTQYRKITTSDLAEGMVMMTLPSMGIMPMQGRETVTLKLPYFGAWVLSISASKVAEQRRPMVVEMKRKMLDALERQLGQTFGLPMMEAEEMLKLPLPPKALSHMDPADCRAVREKVVANPPAFQAVGLLRLGLAASKVAQLVGCSVYAARNQARLYRRIGLVPLSARQQRLLDQPSLFGEG